MHILKCPFQTDRLSLSAKEKLGCYVVRTDIKRNFLKNLLAILDCSDLCVFGPLSKISSHGDMEILLWWYLSTSKLHIKSNINLQWEERYCGQNNAFGFPEILKRSNKVLGTQVLSLFFSLESFVLASVNMAFKVLLKFQPFPWVALLWPWFRAERDGHLRQQIVSAVKGLPKQKHPENLPDSVLQLQLVSLVQVGKLSFCDDMEEYGANTLALLFRISPVEMTGHGLDSNSYLF